MQTAVDQPKQTSAPGHARIGLLWGLGCALVVALVWAAALSKVHNDEQHLIDEALVDAGFRARTYEEQLLRTVTQIDQLSMSIKYQWERRSGALNLEEQYARGVYPTDLYPVAIDAGGYAVSSTRRLPRGTYMGDLDFFLHHKAAGRSQLLISPPTEGRGGFAGKQIVRFSRSFNKPDGSFDGVVLIAIEADRLAAFHDLAKLATGDFAAVRFADGAPLVARAAGDVPARLFLDRPRFDGDEGARTEAAEAFLDRQTRIVSWKRLDGYPLIAVAAAGLATALVPYEETENTYLGIAALASLLLVVAAVLGAGAQMRQLAQRRHQAEVQSTFRLAVDGAREAFYMMVPVADADDWLLEDCNERGAELQGRLRAELVGCTLSQLYAGDDLESVLSFCQRVQRNGFVEEEFHVPHDRSHAAGWFQRRGVRSGIGIAVTVRDVSEARQQAATLAAMARTDALTGLPNRHWLNDYLPGALDAANRAYGKLALLYIDLDNFKHINDALGHRVGDEVLVSVARCLENTLGQRGRLARIGGDEFTVIVESVADGSEPAAIAGRLIDALGRLGAGTDWRMFSLRASIGISLFPDDAHDVVGLLRAADIAMYEAKSAGKAQFRHFDETFAQKIRDRISIEHELELALRHDEFIVYYQPRADAGSGILCGMEALIRWRHPQRGLVGPTEFIGIAEQTGLIVPIGELVVKKVCAQLAAWRSAGLAPRPVSVNVSALQLTSDRFRLTLADELQRHGLPAALVAIELTESSMLDDSGFAQGELRLLRQMGIELEIDDFGTGYSSLSKLQSLDIDVLKIDQSFVRKLGADRQTWALCQSMVSVGRDLGIAVVAEGVETVRQLQILREMGCHQIQGYLVSPPVPPEKIPALVARSFFAPLTQPA